MTIRGDSGANPTQGEAARPLYRQEEGTMYATSIYTKFLAIILTVVIVLPFASYEAYSSKPGEVTATGFIKKQGITTYMYGTHVLLDEKGQTLYALKSETIDLNKYINRKVTIRGYLVKGYPTDSGPNYLHVKFIK